MSLAGVVVAAQRIEARVACLGDDLAVAVGVEAVHHHAVVAGQVAHRLHDAVLQRTQGGRGTEALHAGGQHPAQDLGLQRQRRRAAVGWLHGLQFHHQPAAGCAVCGAFQRAPRCAAADTALQGQRLQAQVRQQPQHRSGQVAAQRRDRALQQVGRRHAQQGLRVDAGLQHLQLRQAQQQQRAVRLHRARQVDELALAVGQVGLTEGGAVHARIRSVFQRRTRSQHVALTDSADERRWTVGAGRSASGGAAAAFCGGLGCMAAR